MEGLFNRRYLRVKVMQAVYAYDSANHNLELGEKSLVKSLDDVYTLYINMLSLLLEVVDMSRKSIELKKEKRLVTEEDLNPNLRFAQNGAALTIENNRKYKLYAEKLDWSVESDNIKKIWKEVEADKKYKAFMSNPRHNFQHDIEIMIYIFKNYIAVNEVFLDLFEERNIYWYDDVQMVSINVVKTLSGLRPEMDEFDSILMQLFKNQKEDLKFVKELYHKTVLQSDASMKLIEKYTKNWDVDRIARLDTVLMKISITEFTSFPNIPVKVTMNEYLEISKNYSTEKSRVFINGVLDKVLVDLKNENKLNKSGMGLINR
ncbi:transcription antitermination factor NusB [bacterium SCSIO 12643]|nr:transcription antitermination factor NusB [bacterium SCSIO 12643]